MNDNLITLNDGDLCSIEGTIVDPDITFFNEGTESIRISSDGKFYVMGKEIKEDIELYNAFVKFFQQMGLYPTN
jgi:hypothetical protein